MAEILTEETDAVKKKQNLSHAATPPAPFTDPNGAENDDSKAKPKLPKGVILDKDGKPCRTCTSLADWRALAKMKSSSSSSFSHTNSNSFQSSVPSVTDTSVSPPDVPTNCPPDVDALGRSTWTLLHSMTATYPNRASSQQQDDMRSFLSLFSKLYPCWVCADDFRAWMNNTKNQPRLGGRAEFGIWMCDAHNAVNRKLGKKEFDCSKWEERWRTGWKDGSCD